MKKQILLVAFVVSGCGDGTRGDDAANAGNAAAMEAPGNRSAGVGSAESGEPPAAYRAAFNERRTPTEASITPDEVTAMLDRERPEQVVLALYGDGEDTRWHTVLNGIARGEAAWLALAPRMARGSTDGGVSIEFAVAAQDALTTNARGALAMLAETVMGAGACAENGMEVPVAQERIFYQTAIATVEAVSDPSLQEIRTECLTSLRSGLAELATRPAS